MKLLLSIVALVVTLAAGASAQDYHYRSGYTTKSGTYVAPGYQTDPNGTRFDNWSTKGNYNPFTGAAGTKSPYTPYTPKAPAGGYGAGGRYGFGK